MDWDEIYFFIFFWGCWSYWSWNMKEATEYPGTSYVPEIEEASRKARERLVVEEGSALWARRKEELRRQKRRDQLQVKFIRSRLYPYKNEEKKKNRKLKINK